ncbi:hypothetical protein [Qipengyuania zhejiangensis]|uniref:hypothetical protein n=1 Tax=Qipengyuania zhejiangensis TaxID=3077782 RepID=UPI002D78AE8E|nr:hypothetical protein [Qipengyuania sp. Z2]
MTEAEIAKERERLADLALEIAARRGEETTRAALVSETRLTRARIETIFPDEEDLFDATVERWFDPEIAMMEDVLASDLPVNRKFYEFIARRFVRRREEYARDPGLYRMLCELGAARYERVRSFVDLADHYLCEIIAQAQADGHFAGLEIEDARSLISQMVSCYTMPDMVPLLEDRLTEDKLGSIVDTLFAGLSAQNGGARGTRDLRAA